MVVSERTVVSERMVIRIFVNISVSVRMMVRILLRVIARGCSSVRVRSNPSHRSAVTTVIISQH